MQEMMAVNAGLLSALNGLSDHTELERMRDGIDRWDRERPELGPPVRYVARLLEQNKRKAKRVALLLELLREATEGRFRRTPWQRAMAPVLDRARGVVLETVLVGIMEMA